MSDHANSDLLLQGIRGMDQCAAAVQRALCEAAKSRAIDPDSDPSDEAWCVAVEAQYMIQQWRRLRGRSEGATYYA